MLWLNHGPSLRALGATSREYFQEVRFELSRFVRRLSASVSRRAEHVDDSGATIGGRGLTEITKPSEVASTCFPSARWYWPRF
jgi:hypothetical protein